MRIRIVSTDITKIECDAIVNPTDPYFSAGGGVDRAVRLSAGKELTEYLKNAPPLGVSEIYETPAFGLSCKRILHTVGPVWNFGRSGETAALVKCYENALTAAVRAGDERVAFPLISSGTNGFPKDRVMAIAREAIKEFLSDKDWDPEIILSVPDKNEFVCPDEYEFRYRFMPSERPVGALHDVDEIREYKAAKRIGNRKTAARAEAYGIALQKCEEMTISETVAEPRADAEPSLEDWLRNLDDTFAVTLFKLIDKKGMTDVQCYKKANVSRKTFYKIRSEENYRPSKATVISFAIALGLDLSETQALLKTVGLTLSGSDRFDVIVTYCIRSGIYDVFKINDLLFRFDQPTLGC